MSAEGRRLLAGLLALVVLFLGIHFGTHAASGADSYGYVSQADLWLHGRLQVDQSSAVNAFDWPDADASLAPLGYRPGRGAHVIVPTYPPGLPMLMAAFKLAGGEPAVYLVVPLLAALGVYLTARLGDAALGPPGGTLAALLLASSPAFLYELMLPMSDIPAMTFWLLAGVLLVADRSRPLAAGLAASAAILARPNLVPLAGVLAVPFLLQRQRPTARIAWLIVGLLPALVLVPTINWRLYGRPLTSGYGGLGDLFSPAAAPGTLVHYLTLLIETQTPLVVLALVGAVRPRTIGASGPALRWTLVGTVVIVLGVYACYTRFEEWWYLRYLLPAYPALLVLTVGGLTALLLPRPDRSSGDRSLGLRRVAAVTVCLLVAAFGVRTAIARGALGLQEAEGRYRHVADGVRRITPAGAVIVCSQHSGSIRYYAARLTVRFDALPPGALEQALRALESQGRRVLFLLEDWEEPGFRKRFASHSRYGQLDWSPVVRLWPSPAVHLYDPHDAPLPQ